MASGAVDAEPLPDDAHRRAHQHARLQARGFVTRDMFDGPRAVFRAVPEGPEDPPQE